MSYLELSPSDVNLTQNGCSTLQAVTSEQDALLTQPYTFQVLSLKSAPATGQDQPARYRLIVSDGQHLLQCLLDTTLNHFIEENKLPKNAIVKFTQTTIANKDKAVVIIMAMEVLGVCPERIGEPSKSVASSTPQPTEASSSNQIAAASTTPQKKVTVFPIEALSPYQTNWTIRARVTQKSDIRSFSTNRSSGKFFTVNLMDESSEIRATAWNDVADKLHEILQVDKAYYISKARVNLAKKKFSTLANDYELGLESHTVVEECTDAKEIPQIQYNFVTLGQLESIPKDSIIDVIAVLQEADEAKTIESQKLNKPLTKRELTLVDQSATSVRLTLWGQEAENFSAPPGTVLAFKSVKLGDFGGRSLSALSSSLMSLDPQITESFMLAGWFKDQGQSTAFKPQTSSSGPGGGPATFNRKEYRAILSAKEAEIGAEGKDEFFTSRASIMHIKDNGTTMYPACTKQGCNRKVVETTNNKWECAKCTVTLDEPQWRFVLPLAVADYSGHAWFQGFNDVGEKVLGMTANELHRIKTEKSEEEGEEACKAIFGRANGQTFNFSIRAKLDSYNGTQRTRYGISRIWSLDYHEEAISLRDRLRGSWN